MGGALVVGVDGQVAEGVVVAAQRLRAGDQPRLPARVDDEARPLRLALPGDAHADRALPVEQHLRDVASLPHLDAGGARVVEQQLIEARPPDLVRVGMGAVRLTEVPRPRGRVAAPDHRRAGLLDEALALDRLQHAQRVEDRQRRRQQRFTDVRPGEAFALAAEHPPSTPRQQRGRGAAARPAPDDDHVPGAVGGAVVGRGVAGHGAPRGRGTRRVPPGVRAGPSVPDASPRRAPRRRPPPPPRPAPACAGPSRTDPAGPAPCPSRARRG